MRSLISVAFASLACCLLVLTGPSALAAAQTASPAPSTLSRLDRVIEDRVDASGVPGFALAVVANDRVVHARGFGDADPSGRDVTADTPFVTGSSGKALTAFALMQLVEAGRIDLDAPVRRYVPEFHIADRANANRIRVRHLVQHTSGLPAEGVGPILASAAEGSALEAIAELRDIKLVSRPGESWHYANANYVLAGLVIERASGESFAAYMQRHVFEPIGMTRTFTSLSEAKAAGVAKGARYWFGLTRWHGPTFRAGTQAAGYFVSTAADLARFLQVFLNGGVIEGRRVLTEAGIEQLLDPGRRAHLGPWADDAQSRYAMGWFVGGPWDERVVFHPGNTPDSSSMIVLMPERGWAVAALTNISNELPVPGNPSVPDRLARDAVDVLLGEPVTGTSGRQFYIVFDLVLLALLGVLMWSLARAVMALKRHTSVEHPIRSATSTVMQAVAGAIVTLIPSVGPGGWAASWLWWPDLTLALVTSGVLLVITAATRVLWLARWKRRDRHPPELMSEPVNALEPDRKLMLR